MESVKIRQIRAADNEALAALIRSVLVAHEVPATGSTMADESLDHLFEFYSQERSVYLVLEIDGQVAGGSGISQLQQVEETVCELQKMYFLPAARGKGLGSTMLEKCLEYARSFGYETCYLETMPQMKAALAMYEAKGFKYLDAPMGNTGHCNCQVWMARKL
ncbi:GNAT family N-acetyltransferase [Zeaxanthinibacter enoshimensis]|uniref:Putative acetyltransferase n=1 Tax=Zeaxanthinibacter enoshimensis TaxID=392009 RepID=A0A4R6TQG7_9FLAO|nr:GNAT family N-acetyltransferase [Zeaxanthinibacter enoshimensis]TDQ31641.1 putative acetyltransferase [Zeaxanthinibacter enoshimensis]